MGAHGCLQQVERPDNDSPTGRIASEPRLTLQMVCRTASKPSMAFPARYVDQGLCALACEPELGQSVVQNFIRQHKGPGLELCGQAGRDMVPGRVWLVNRALKRRHIPEGVLKIGLGCVHKF